MESYARSCYPMAVQAVRDAILKDSNGQTKDAYCCYLSSILFMIQALKDEAWESKEIKDLCHDGSIKLYKLIEQSLGRARDILNIQNPDGNENKNEVPKSNESSSLPVPVVTNSSSISPRSPVVTRKASSQSITTPEMITSLPTPPGISSLPSPPGYPTLQKITKGYHAQNYDMFQAYQRRKSKDSVLQKYASCNYSLSMFREMAESKKINDIKQKAYQEKMQKRRQEIKVEAEKRWNEMNKRSSRDKEYRQDLLETILAYEQDTTWPIAMREMLAINFEDTSTITKVVCTILTYNGHPLCRVLKGIQYEIYSNIEPLIKDFKLPSELADDYYLVPVEDITQGDHTHILPAISQAHENEYYENTTGNSPKSGTESQKNKHEPMDVSNNANNSTESSLDNRFNDLEDDMFSSDSENEGDNKLYNLLTPMTENTNKHENMYTDSVQDNSYNHLWEASESESIYQELGETEISKNISRKDAVNEIEEDSTESIYQDPSSQHSTTEPSHYECLTSYQENIYEDVNEVVASIKSNEHLTRSISPVTLKRLSRDFLKTLDRIIQDIIFGIDRLHSVILLTYQSMDHPVGRDISYANLECIFFKPIWPWLIRLFRKMNIDKEDAMAEVMRNYKNCSPSLINIRDELKLGSNQDCNKEPYLEAIEEMKRVVQFVSPLDKLECAVRVSKAICHSVETYYSEKGEKAPAVGCDDLLPIVSYVVLKSQLPQIVSECHAMTEFIHDGYLMGEEGYCLTTLHAAISNLLSYAKPRE